VFGTWGFVTTFYVSKLNEISFRFPFFYRGKSDIKWGVWEDFQGDNAEKVGIYFYAKTWGPVT